MDLNALVNAPGHCDTLSNMHSATINSSNSNGNQPSQDGTQAVLPVIDYATVVSSMVSKVKNTLRLGESERAMLDRLVSIASDMDDILAGRAEIHLIITMVNDDSNGQQLMAAPVLSKLLTTALDRRRTTA